MPLVFLLLLIHTCNSDWEDTYPECGLARQSPINLNTNDATTCEQPLQLEWNSTIEQFAVRNNGHSLQLIPFEIQHAGGPDLNELEILYHANDSKIRLENPFYNTFKSLTNSEYCFDSLHFHWDNSNEYGSEHTLNGKRYPLELHLVHYSCDYYVGRTALEEYANGETAQLYDDDNVLAVIGILFEIGEANPALDIILEDDIINNIYKYRGNVDRNFIQLHYVVFDLIDLLPSNKEVIAYKGSLTTPPCYETVRWNVLKNTATVSEEQMGKFRMLLASMNVSDTLAPNWRPLQDIGERELYECKEDVDALAVEKDKAVVKAPEGFVVDTWQAIAIAFIVGFGISMIANIWLLRRNDRKEKEVLNSKSLILTETVSK